VQEGLLRIEFPRTHFFLLSISNWQAAYAFCMAAARLAILAFFVSITLRAESPSRIAIKVTDPTGAPISHARVQARTSESRVTAEIESDAQGEAVLDLAPSTSIISVRAPGFKVWQFKIDAVKNVDQPLHAVLQIGSYSGPTVVNAEPALVTQPQPPSAAMIPLESLESLIALPTRKLRHLGRAHLMAN
jgi:hypothetical protein